LLNQQDDRHQGNFSILNLAIIYVETFDNNVLAY